jgi:Fur family ferric uptake transcriptional regulator
MHSHEHHHSSEEEKSRLDRALDVLRSAGHRITAPRKALLRVLIREHGPFSAEELHRLLPSGLCDPVTVYRSIGALEETNLVRRCDFGDGTYRYEFNTGEHHHHHIICRQCSSVRNLEVCFADGLERLVRQMGYANVTHTLEIFGTCVDCQARRGRTAPE